MDYTAFCKNGDGSWNRAKEYEWTTIMVGKEYDSGAYGKYSREVAKSDDTSLITALLYECGIKSEGLMTPLLGKHILHDPADAGYVYDLISSHASEGRFQELLTKYCKIKSEFTKRHQANQAEMERKFGNDSTPKQKVRSFRISG